MFKIRSGFKGCKSNLSHCMRQKTESPWTGCCPGILVVQLGDIEWMAMGTCPRSQRSLGTSQISGPITACTVPPTSSCSFVSVSASHVPADPSRPLPQCWVILYHRWVISWVSSRSLPKPKDHDGSENSPWQKHSVRSGGGTTPLPHSTPLFPTPISPYRAADMSPPTHQTRRVSTVQVR